MSKPFDYALEMVERTRYLPSERLKPCNGETRDGATARAAILELFEPQGLPN